MKYKSMVSEWTTSTGTGAVALGSGAVDGFRTFAAAGLVATDWVPYYLHGSDGSFERGIGQLQTGLGSLTRNVVLESSNSDALISLPAGSHQVRIEPQPPLFTERRGAMASNTTTSTPIVAGGIYDVILDAADFDTDSCFAAGTATLTPPAWCDTFQSTAYLWLDATVLPVGSVHVAFFHPGTSVEQAPVSNPAVALPFLNDGGSYYTDFAFTSPVMRRVAGQSPTVKLRIWNVTDQTLTLNTGSAYLRLDLLG